ncbi:MAG: type III toxin-antitoxin system ToxN/AbiQ family toxin [Ruminococcus sp.]|nr:type III toxin-antitoxin system ToxN/AbiQ family toxin [Ruminococcus sp.]
MKNSLVLVKLDKDYCNYLRQFDYRVPYNFNDKVKRPFIGVLFKVNNFMYFAPLSSPKKKHLKLVSKIDFLKIDNGKLGAINFNNMLPVTENNIIMINIKDSSKADYKYIKLLKEQLYWLNRNSDKLYTRSKKLYDKYLDGTLNLNIRKRCCNFKLLEEKCLEYNKKLIST